VKVANAPALARSKKVRAARATSLRLNITATPYPPIEARSASRTSPGSNQ
jgi:hypothetical protein